jgi:hypothetical protein
MTLAKLQFWSPEAQASAQTRVAPTELGKTGYVLDVAREAAQNLQLAPRVLVPTRLQARSC